MKAVVEGEVLKAFLISVALLFFSATYMVMNFLSFSFSVNRLIQFNKGNFSLNLALFISPLRGRYVGNFHFSLTKARSIEAVPTSIQPSSNEKRMFSSLYLTDRNEPLRGDSKYKKPEERIKEGFKRSGEFKGGYAEA